MIRLTDKQFRSVKAMIKKECGDYIDGNCILLDTECPQCITKSLCCRYFINSVLPGDKVLDADINGGKNMEKCSCCGKKFIRTNNRQKYCTDCAKAERAKKRRKYNRENYTKSKLK